MSDQKLLLSFSCTCFTSVCCFPQSAVPTFRLHESETVFQEYNKNQRTIHVAKEEGAVFGWRRYGSAVVDNSRVHRSGASLLQSLVVHFAVFADRHFPFQRLLDMQISAV